MGARSYIPSLGRFLQVDPVDGGSANPYDYVNQDPLDLDGRIRGACAQKGSAAGAEYQKRKKSNARIGAGTKTTLDVACLLAIRAPTPVTVACSLYGAEQLLDRLPPAKQHGCPYPNKGRYRHIHHERCS
jgi:hypothetical protein